MSKEAQQAVLGAAILDADCAKDAALQLSPAMFQGADREIFQAIQRLYRDGKPIDAVTLLGLVPEQKVYIMQLAEFVPRVSAMGEYIRMVQEDWQWEQLQGALTDLGMFGGGTLGQTLDDLESLLREHRDLQTAMRRDDGVTTFAQAVEDFFTWMQERETRAQHLTGMESFDHVVGGFNPGTVFTLAARPGCGKTDFALNLALKLVKKGAKVMYFTLEMTNNQMMARVASYVMKINSILIRDMAISEEEKKQMHTVLQNLVGGDKLSFVEEPRISVGKVARHVEDWSPDVVFIDHIGLMERPKANSDYKALGLVSNQLKELAIRKKIAIVQLSQMNRQVEARASGEPNLSDLRESGDLEQDSDNVAFLVPQKADGEQISGSEYLDVTLKLAKNREGSEGARLRFKWQPQYHTYTEVDSRYD